MDYYFLVGPETRGPFTREELKDRAISARTLFWREGLETWTMGVDLPELSGVFPSSPPPPPPPPPPTTHAPALRKASEKPHSSASNPERRNAMVGGGIAILALVVGLSKGCRMIQGLSKDFGNQPRSNQPSKRGRP